MYYFQTHKGLVREKNEDNVDVFVHDNITFMLVLDGMGGHNRGDKASSLALETIKNYILKKKRIYTLQHLKRIMVKAIKKANKEVNVLGSSNIKYNEMGTTLVFVSLYKNHLILCNIGDSRCYLIKDKSLIQISEDQTYVEFLYKTGKISYEEKFTHPKRHVLMNALGTYPSISIAIDKFKGPFEKILLCSDGLYNMVEKEKIEKILLEDKETKLKVEELIDLSNFNGGKDNIAIALWEEK